MICSRRVLFMMTLVIVGTVSTTSAAEPSKHLLGKLREGQPVMLKETNGRFEIVVMKQVPVGHKVVEVGDDYVELIHVSEITTTIIPIYSIKSITVMKLSEK